MATEVIMPKMGQTMEEGTILEWYKAEGESVARGEPLFQVESDKAVFDIESPANGTVRRIWFPGGTTVPMLSRLALIGEPAEDLSGYETPREATGLTETAPASAPEPTLPPAVVQPGGRDRLFVSPRARRLAAEKRVNPRQLIGTGPQGSIVERDVLAHLAARPRVTPTARRLAMQTGVDLSTLSGAGPAGRVARADVEAALAAKTASAVAPAEREIVPLTGVRRLIAQRMAQSAHTTAGLTLTTEADATELVTLVRRFRELLTDQDVIPGYSDLLLKALGRALQDHPHLNARWVEEVSAPVGIDLQRDINIGIAIDTERGLMVPVIADVPSRGLSEIARERRALTERALTGRLLPDDLVGGTFTLTNLGMFDIDAFTPLINLPECAILGVGRIRAKPAVHDGEVCVRHTMALSLTFDHRIVDGAPAARFLQQVKLLIEQPALLLL